MQLNSTYHGACPAPFYDASLFPEEGGYLDGRFCSIQDLLPGSPSCCLPCPAAYWTYPDTFNTYNAVAAWLNVVCFILLTFMLTSYFFLPVQQTRSHYLSISLIVAILFINLGFIVPLGAQPEQCYNEITPNDMYSSMTCAWSGAFIIAGGLSGAVWICVRALSMHLQICWDIIPGRRFFFLSQALGWGVPAAIFTATLTVTGVSFRFGNACHVNHNQSMQSFWGWLLSIAAAAVILQLSTLGYCAHVFISNLWSDENQSSRETGNDLPRYSASVRAQTAKAIWRRLKKVLYLQWRGILIVTITLVDVIFFAVVFVYLDNIESHIVKETTRAEPWIICLVMTGGDKNQCMEQSEEWLISERVVGAVLIMLSLIGLEVFCLLFRWSLIEGWREYFVERFHKKQEFVSVDALSPQSRPTYVGSQQYGANGVAFEMQTPREHAYDRDAKKPSPVLTTVAVSESDSYSPPHFGPETPEPGFSGYFNTNESRSQFSLQIPQCSEGVPRRSASDSSQERHSFASMRMPTNTTVQNMGWDPTSSYAASSALGSPVAQSPRSGKNTPSPRSS